MYLLGLLYIANRLTNSCYIFCLIVRDLYIEFFFKFHDQLYRIQGIGTQVVRKASFRNHLIFVNTKLIYNDSLNS